ncbi:MAG: PQQ-binding-like beta-propeller repeat protein [Rubripirellula sp.]
MEARSTPPFTAVLGLGWSLLCAVTTGVAADDLRVHAGIRFLTPTSAELCFESNLAGEASVAIGPTRKLGTILKSEVVGTRHCVVLPDLKSATTYHYRISIVAEGKRHFSSFFEFDGRMNYTTKAVASPSTSDAIAQVVKSMNHSNGFAVVDNEVANQWGLALAKESQLTVVAAAEDESQLQKRRTEWSQLKDYGVRLSAQLTNDIPAHFANVVVTTSDQLSVYSKFASPMGILVCLDQPPDDSDWRWTAQDSLWIGQPVQPTQLTRWGHQYGSPASGSYVGEDLGGIDDTADLEVRWLGRPGADFGIDRNPRMPAPLAVGGRLFHQGMNRMIALDAFNGTVLWSLEIPDLRRVNIPRDCGNWCADAKHVYAVTGECLWSINAATGVMEHTVRLPKPFDQKFDWGYVAVTDNHVIGTAVKKGSAFQDYWAKAAWYDGKNEAATAKVCGSGIVVFDKQYGDVKWQREVDAVVHSTITVNNNRMYFVESTGQEIRQSKTGKLSNQQIWKRASVVCLDLDSGTELWKQPLPDQKDDQIIAFGLADDGQFVFQSSSEEQFHFTSFDSESGKTRWSRSVKWPSDNHGAHMQHAVLMNKKLFVQPHILSADDGSVLQTGTLGKRRGCATPIGAGNSIIYRGGTGPLSLWSLDDNKPSEFTRLRPSCWLSTIPAQGMLFSPEAGGGCSCGGWMECSIGFAPRLSEPDPSK